MWRKANFYLVVALVVNAPVQLTADEVAGFDVSSKQYAELVENMAKCRGYFTAAQERAYELQFEVDDKEFEDSALHKNAKLLSLANKSMLEAEKNLPDKHREYLNSKREYTGFGIGYGSTIPVTMLASDLRECVVQAEVVLNIE